MALSARKGVLFRVNPRNQEISLAEERGVRTYRAIHDLALHLENNNIVLGEFVKVFFDHPEKQVTRVVPQTCSGKLQKWSEKYAFISCLSSVPSMKTKKRRVTEFALKVSSENVFIDSDEMSTVSCFETNSVVNFNVVVALTSTKNPCSLTAKRITLAAIKPSTETTKRSPAQIESWFSRRMSTPAKRKEGSGCPTSATRSKRKARQEQTVDQRPSNQDLADENKFLKQQLSQLLHQQGHPGLSLPAPVEPEFEEFEDGRPTSTRSEWGAAGPPRGAFWEFRPQAERLEPYRREQRPLSNPFPTYTFPPHPETQRRRPRRFRQRSAPSEMYYRHGDHIEWEPLAHPLDFENPTYI